MANLFGDNKKNTLGNDFANMNFMPMDFEGGQSQPYLKDREIKIDTSGFIPLKTNQIRPLPSLFYPASPQIPEGYVDTFFSPQRNYAKPAPKVYFG